MKVKVRFIKIKSKNKKDKEYYVIATNAKGEKIAFISDGIK